MYTITQTQQDNIARLVEDMVIPVGVGTPESACSIAAINIALSGRLTDEIPECMSYVIGRWIIRIQDKMPNDIRNSKEWKRLLPLAVGTGRNHEKECTSVIMDHLFGVILNSLQPIAEKNGFGNEWWRMVTERTPESCLTAKKSAAYAAYAADAADAADAAADAAYAADAADAADAAADAAYAADAADAYAAYAAYAADAAADAAYAAYAADAADAAVAADFWSTVVTPVELLEKLILVTQ